MFSCAHSSAVRMASISSISCWTVSTGSGGTEFSEPSKINGTSRAEWIGGGRQDDRRIFGGKALGFRFHAGLENIGMLEHATPMYPASTMSLVGPANPLPIMLATASG